MNKAFTKEPEGDDDGDDAVLPSLPAGVRNYLTPPGYRRRHFFHLQRSTSSPAACTTPPTATPAALCLRCRLGEGAGDRLMIKGGSASGAARSRSNRR